MYLVRDLHALAYSRMRKTIHPEPKISEYVPLRSSPAASSVRWTVRNLVNEALWRFSPKRYLLLRFENLIAETQKAIERLLELVGEEAVPRPYAGASEMKLGANRNVWENSSRFRTRTM